MRRRLTAKAARENWAATVLLAEDDQAQALREQRDAERAISGPIVAALLAGTERDEIRWTESVTLGLWWTQIAGVCVRVFSHSIETGLSGDRLWADTFSLIVEVQLQKRRGQSWSLATLREALGVEP